MDQKLYKQAATQAGTSLDDWRKLYATVREDGTDPTLVREMYGAISHMETVQAYAGQQGGLDVPPTYQEVVARVETVKTGTADKSK